MINYEAVFKKVPVPNLCVRIPTDQLVIPAWLYVRLPQYEMLRRRMKIRPTSIEDLEHQRNVIAFEVSEEMGIWP